MSPLTSTQIADILGRLGSRGYQDTSRLHRQIRNLHSKGLLPSVGVRDSRGTAEFDPEVLPLACILTRLADHGFDVRTLRAVVEAAGRSTLDYTSPDQRAPSLKGDGHWRSNGGLKDAIKGIREGEQWSLRLGGREASFGDSTHFARFVWDGEVENKDAARIAADYNAARNVLPYIFTTVRLNPLLEPLLNGGTG